MKQHTELEQLFASVHPILQENSPISSSSSSPSAFSEEDKGNQHFMDFYHRTAAVVPEHGSAPFGNGIRIDNRQAGMESAPESADFPEGRHIVINNRQAGIKSDSDPTHFPVHGQFRIENPQLAADRVAADFWKLNLDSKVSPLDGFYGGDQRRLPNGFHDDQRGLPNGFHDDQPGVPNGFHDANVSDYFLGGPSSFLYGGAIRHDALRPAPFSGQYFRPYNTGRLHHDLRFMNNQILEQARFNEQTLELGADYQALQQAYLRKQNDMYFNNKSEDPMSGHHYPQDGYYSPSRNLTEDRFRVLFYDRSYGMKMENDQGYLNTVHTPSEDEILTRQPPKYVSIEEVKGHMNAIARDQHGCRFLQKKFDEGTPEDAKAIFSEIIDHIVDLMTDPFGNYLVQKIVEVCNSEQRMRILELVTANSTLVTISLNMHGTRAVQKLIEAVDTPEEKNMVISSLSGGVVMLIKDSNGNHVVQRCLLRLSNEENQFIFDAAISHCVEIAAHRHGCCVLQRCVDFAKGLRHSRLVAEIAANSLILAQDPYGNYVVQYILDLRYPWARVEVISRLSGNFAHLAMQKFSSNVVEKCLNVAEEEHKACIIHELVGFPSFVQLLHHQYANYVIQSALSTTAGALHNSLEEAIRPHVAALRSSPFGKRILSKTSMRK